MYLDAIDRPNIAGVIERADYCPMFIPVELCADAANAPEPNPRFATYGEDSLCLESRLGDTKEYGFRAPQPACYSVRCNGVTSITVTASNGESTTCRKRGEKVVIKGIAGYVLCPGVRHVCGAGPGSVSEDDDCDDGALSVVSWVVIGIAIACAVCIGAYTIIRRLQIRRSGGLGRKLSSPRMPTIILREIARLHPLAPLATCFGRCRRRAVVEQGGGDGSEDAASHLDSATRFLLRLVLACELLLAFFLSTFEPTTEVLRALLECESLGVLILARSLTTSVVVAVFGYAHRNAFGVGVEGGSKFVLGSVAMDSAIGEQKVVAKIKAIGFVAMELATLVGASIYAMVILIVAPGSTMLLLFAIAAAGITLLWWPLMALLSAAVWDDARRALEFEASVLEAVEESKRTPSPSIALSSIAAPPPAMQEPVQEDVGAPETKTDASAPDLNQHLPSAIQPGEWRRAIEGRVNGWETLRPSKSGSM